MFPFILEIYKTIIHKPVSSKLENTVKIEPTRILLVEDDPNDVELIQLALESHHFVNQMDVVMDGAQALSYLHGSGETSAPHLLPRLVLLDLKLPKVDGLQVLRAIRAHPQTKDLVVVVMTSSAENQDLSTCYELGVNSYIVKPLDFKQFMDVACQVGFYWMMLNQVPLDDWGARGANGHWSKLATYEEYFGIECYILEVREPYRDANSHSFSVEIHASSSQ